MNIEKYKVAAHKIFFISEEALESVMCDVIKIRLKRRDERGSGKGNP